MKKHLIYSIGDIHGCLKTLDALWLKIEHHMNSNPSEKRTVVFLGDYVDRGPDSSGVVHRIMEMSELFPEYGIDLVALKGNHEDMMISAHENQMSSDARLWYSNGGVQTMDSYTSVVPDSHLAFLKGLKVWHQIGRFVFVHAGIEPFREMEYQTEADMLWGRDWVYYDGPFDDDERLFVVHGHTPYDGPIQQLSHQLNIDTACVFNNLLTCVVIEADQEDNNFTFIQEKNIDR